MVLHSFWASYHSGILVGQAVRVLERIASLFDDPLVTDVVFNRFDVAFARAANVWIPAPSPFVSADEFSDWLIEVVEASGSRVDFQNPATSVVCDGYRIHAVIGAGISEGASATIRKLRAPALRFSHTDVATAVRLENLIESGRRRENILFVGAAGAGKTTLLRHFLTQFSSERIVTIEDVAELQLDSPNCIALTSRSSNSEAAGEITLQRLLFEALRMSPDRIAVGEVRGVELVTMLDALHTGHSGAGATIHANSLTGVTDRLMSLGLAAGMSERAVSMQVAAAFTKVAFVSNRNGYRIDSIGTFRLHSGELEVVEID
jgi:pilus assembly protein CpaF